ncbi:MAG TPA: ComF family protein [Patescibacteria group bacterium]|nr:ComF family protein [Patescibacteria group bacterium]
MRFSLFQRITRTVADIIFPVECVGCGKGGFFICDTCLSRIQTFPVHFCHYCKKPQAFGQTCSNCQKRLRLNGLYNLAPYDQKILKDAIHAWKYERVKELGNILGVYLAKHIIRASHPFLNCSIITSIPLARQKQFDRGFNQSTQIARVLSKHLHIPFQETLIRTRNTKSQFALPKIQRELNVKNAFAVRKDMKLQDTSILLVDDVTTTGATLEEACGTLKEAGTVSVYGIAIAHGM